MAEVSRRGAFFDLEKTLTPHAVEQVTALEFHRRGELSLAQILRVIWIYVRYDLGFIADFDAMKRSGAPVFGGRDAARDVLVFRDYFETHLRPAIYPDALAAVRAHQAAGDEVYLISATYGFMVEPYAALLGTTGWRGTTLEVVEGRCTGRITGIIPHQEKKAELVRDIARDRGLDLALSAAYGDSMNDVAMLSAVGHPFVVNPGKKLARLAADRGWATLRWTSPSSAR